MEENTTEISQPVQEAFTLIDIVKEDVDQDLPADANRRPLTTGQKTFLAAYVQTLSITHAATAAQQTRQAHYLSLQRSDTYREVFERIEQVAMRMRLDSWLEDADNGLEKLRFDRNGDPLIDPRTGEPYTEKQIDTVMRIFLMKSRMGLSDQPEPRERSGSGPTVIINMPEQLPPPKIEFNAAEMEDNG